MASQLLLLCYVSQLLYATIKLLIVLSNEVVVVFSSLCSEQTSTILKVLEKKRVAGVDQFDMVTLSQRESLLGTDTV